MILKKTSTGGLNDMGFSILVAYNEEIMILKKTFTGSLNDRGFR